MSLINNINQIADKLASLYLFKGIQPSEISDAIFEKQFSTITINKTEYEIILVANFVESDEITNQEYKHQIKYIYCKNKYLKRIEQKVGNRNFKLQWSREDEVSSLINQFIGHVKNNISSIQLEKILATLPIELQPKIYTKLKLVA
jgi:hypothetical protein